MQGGVRVYLYLPRRLSLTHSVCCRHRDGYGRRRCTFHTTTLGTLPVLTTRPNRRLQGVLVFDSWEIGGTTRYVSRV